MLEILAHFDTGKDWQQAFFKTLPQRKGAAKLGEGRPAKAEVKVAEGAGASAGGPTGPLSSRDGEKICRAFLSPEGCHWEEKVGRPCKYLHEPLPQAGSETQGAVGRVDEGGTDGIGEGGAASVAE